MTISKVIDSLTKDIWENISLAHALGTKYGEETISDILLLELAKLKSYNLKIIQTSKYREKITGTDWEWFIGSQKYGWIRFAIQAKKIDITSKNGNYRLKHSVGNRMQIDILKEYSNANNAIPLFCFYNNYLKTEENAHWHCNLKYEKKLLGWTVTSLKNAEFALAGRGRKNFSFIHSLKETLPMKCLFECPSFIKEYTKMDTNDSSVTILGERAIKIKTLPFELAFEQDILPIASLPDNLYDSRIEIYPKRIVIFDISQDLSDKR